MTTITVWRRMKMVAMTMALLQGLGGGCMGDISGGSCLWLSSSWRNRPRNYCHHHPRPSYCQQCKTPPFIWPFCLFVDCLELTHPHNMLIVIPPPSCHLYRLQLSPSFVIGVVICLFCCPTSGSTITTTSDNGLCCASIRLMVCVALMLLVFVMPPSPHPCWRLIQLPMRGAFVEVQTLCPQMPGHPSTPSCHPRPPLTLFDLCCKQLVRSYRALWTARLREWHSVIPLPWNDPATVDCRIWSPIHLHQWTWRWTKSVVAPKAHHLWLWQCQ